MSVEQRSTHDLEREHWKERVTYKCTCPAKNRVLLPQTSNVAFAQRNWHAVSLK